MRCIFCRSESDTSKSVEHIIPESLGNTKSTLPPGIVCDKCNNYFARKVEGKLLSSDYFIVSRFRNSIPNKKGIIPHITPIVGPDSTTFSMYKTTGGLQGIYPSDDESNHRLISHLQTHKTATLTFTNKNICNRHLMSRLLAKISLELLASRVMIFPGWEDGVIFMPELDKLRNFARHGHHPREWEFYERRIYDESTPRTDPKGEMYETLNEMDLLFKNGCYLFGVICIFGIEYTIDMANPSIHRYTQWLEENNFESPLYTGKNRLIYK